MKPDWKDAPEWAQWLAMDGDGYWCWFQSRPYYDSDLAQWIYSDEDSGRSKAQYADVGADHSGIDWDFAYSTLEPRP